MSMPENILLSNNTGLGLSFDCSDKLNQILSRYNPQHKRVNEIAYRVIPYLAFSALPFLAVSLNDTSYESPLLENLIWLNLPCRSLLFFVLDSGNTLGHFILAANFKKKGDYDSAKEHIKAAMPHLCNGGINGALSIFPGCTSIRETAIVIEAIALLTIPRQMNTLLKIISNITSNITNKILNKIFGSSDGFDFLQQLQPYRDDLDKKFKEERQAKREAIEACNRMDHPLTRIDPIVAKGSNTDFPQPRDLPRTMIVDEQGKRINIFFNGKFLRIDVPTGIISSDLVEYLNNMPFEEILSDQNRNALVQSSRSNQPNMIVDGDMLYIEIDLGTEHRILTIDLTKIVITPEVFGFLQGLLNPKAETEAIVPYNCVSRTREPSRIEELNSDEEIDGENASTSSDIIDLSLEAANGFLDSESAQETQSEIQSAVAELSSQTAPEESETSWQRLLNQLNNIAEESAQQRKANTTMAKNLKEALAKAHDDLYKNITKLANDVKLMSAQGLKFKKEQEEELLAKLSRKINELKNDPNRIKSLNDYIIKIRNRANAIREERARLKGLLQQQRELELEEKRRLVQEIKASENGDPKEALLREKQAQAQAVKDLLAQEKEYVEQQRALKLAQNQQKTRKMRSK